ncbi:MAG: DUF1800 domain-containing protein [Acidobacteriota bacterium]
MSKKASLARCARLIGVGALALSLVTTASAQVRSGGSGFGGSGGRGGGGGDLPRSPVAEDEAFLYHVASRLTYGPTPELIAEMREMGVETWIQQQLFPENVDDSEMEATLSTEIDPPDDLFYEWDDFFYEHFHRARYSNRQLQEVMLQFWENHFDTVVVRGNSDEDRHTWTLMERGENLAFRQEAFGNFRDLLEHSAKSQAMMYFLDNFRSTVFELNENYGREILELHSLGVDCGYDQTDVEVVSQIFTGWSGVDLARRLPDPCDEPGEAPPDCQPLDYVEGTFYFNGGAHDQRAKTTLGYDFPAGGGLSEGLQVIDIVSEHPCTARFISLKLIEKFVTDAPTDAYVDRIAGTFLGTGGNIRKVLQEIFASPEFRDPRNFRSKVKTPFEAEIATLRALDGQMRIIWDEDRGEYRGFRDLWYRVNTMGMGLFDFAIPTGFDETGGEWVGANGFLLRWRDAYGLAWRYPSDTQTYWTDPLGQAQRLGLNSADNVVAHFAALLTGGAVSSERKAALIDTLTGGSGVWDPAAPNEPGLREMVSHLLGSPEFIQQ